VSLVKSIIKNSSWSYYVLGFNLITGVLHTGLLARALGVSDYGKYHLIIAFCSLAIGVFGFYGSEALIPFVTKYKTNGNSKNLLRVVNSIISLIYLVSVFGFILFIIIIYYNPELSGLLKNEIMFGILIGMTIVVGSNYYSYLNIMRIFGNFSTHFYQAVIFDTFKVGLALCMYFFNYGLLFYIWGMLIRQILQTIIVDYYARKAIGRAIGFVPHWLFTKKINFFKEEKKYFILNLINSNIKNISLHFDKVLINYLFVNDALVGFYVAAKK
jgi:O-antigen/teichoic acid export membrane protein